MKVFAFEGPHELYGFASLEAAADHLEATDVANGVYEVIGDDGTRDRMGGRASDARTAQWLEATTREHWTGRQPA